MVTKKKRKIFISQMKVRPRGWRNESGIKRIQNGKKESVLYHGRITRAGLGNSVGENNTMLCLSNKSSWSLN